MNPEAQSELERILKLDPSAVTSAEVEFLKARVSYLTSEQKRVFASVLEEEPVESKDKKSKDKKEVKE